MSPDAKKKMELIGGAVAVASGIRDVRKARGGQRIALVHAGLKLIVAVLGIVVALRAAQELAEDVAGGAA